MDCDLTLNRSWFKAALTHRRQYVHIRAIPEAVVRWLVWSPGVG